MSGRITNPPAGPLLVLMALAVVAVAPPAVRAAETGPITFQVTGFEVEGDNPLPARKTRKLLAPYRGEHSGLEGLQAAAEALERALREAGFAFHRVVLPPQPLTGGVVRLEVTALTLERIEVEGNRYFSARQIRAGLPALKPSTASINTRALSRSLAVANLNPAERVRLTFAASDTPGRIDAHIRVKDRRPQRVFAWANNTGTDATGDTRLGLGYQHANLFGRGHVGTVTYTTSAEHPDQVSQYGVHYQLPLYRAGGVISAFFADSDVDTGTVAEFFDVSGKGTVAGVRYTHLFGKRGAYTQRLEGGLTDKLFENNIDFEGTPVGSNVRSRPVSLRYSGEYAGRRTEAGFYLGVAANVSGGSHNDDESYAASRSGASPDWAALYFGGRFRYRIKRWSVVGHLNGQYADEPLIAGEQFGLGGGTSLRGFEEREVTGDRGYRAGLELWAPPLARRSLQLMGFVEGGEAELVNPLPGEIGRETLASAGLGARWAWRDRVNLRLDWGHALDGGDPRRSDATPTGSDKIHFNLLVQY